MCALVLVTKKMIPIEKYSAAARHSHHVEEILLISLRWCELDNSTFESRCAVGLCTCSPQDNQNNWIFTGSTTRCLRQKKRAALVFFWHDHDFSLNDYKIGRLVISQIKRVRWCLIQYLHRFFFSFFFFQRRVLSWALSRVSSLEVTKVYLHVHAQVTVIVMPAGSTDYGREDRKGEFELRGEIGVIWQGLTPSFKNPDHLPQRTNRPANICIWRYRF